MSRIACIICGKTLTDPESIERNMGPICFNAGPPSSEPDISSSTHMDYLDIPIEDGIILRREDDKVKTNVPWVAISGSTDGFEWGYAGSGPGDLAMNILENVLRRMQYRGGRDRVHKGSVYNLAYSCRNDFKSEFLVGMPEAGGVIDYKVAKKWVLNKVVNEQGGENYEY